MRAATRRAAGLALLCACIAGLALGATQASAFRYYQSEITEVPGTADVPGPFGHSFKVATDGSNNLWVLDASGGKGVVNKFSSAGAFLAQGTGEGGWFPDGSELRDLDFNSANGLIYVADNKNGDIWKLNANGVVQGSIPGDPASWSPDAGFDCCTMQLDIDNSGGPGNGDLYVLADSCCSSDNQGIYRVSPTGQKLPFPTSANNVEGNHITGTTNRNEDNISPFGVAVAADGDIWAVTSGSFGSRPDTVGLLRFDASGEYLETFQDFPPLKPSEEASRVLSDIAIDPTNGHIILAAVGPEEFGGAVFELKADGTFIETLTPPSNFTEPTGLAVDDNGQLYVADRGAVKVFGKDFPLPGIAYGAVTGQTQTAGTLHATIDPGEGGPVTSCEVEYGTETSYGSTAPCSPDPAGASFTTPTEVSASLSGLEPEVPYHYRFTAGNANVTRSGEDRVFVPHWVIGLDTTEATALTPSSALLNGSFDGNGKHTTYRFEWGKTDGYGSSTPEVDAGSPTGPTSAASPLAGLSPVTTYHYRLVATNPDGTSNSDDEEFTTPPLPPTLNQWVTDVHSDSVIFNARINPGGGLTKYQVEYVDDAGFQEHGFVGASLAPAAPEKAGSEFKSVDVSTKVAPLTPGTTYHYRVVATNSYKTITAEPRTFTTFAYGGEIVDPCPNSQVRQQTGAALLLECRAYELVSAGNTGGYDVESDIIPGHAPFNGYPLASGPSRVLYGVHRGAIPGNWNPTNLGLDPYVATRGEGGWATQYVGLSASETPSLHPFASAFGGADSTLATVAFAGANLCEPCFGDGSSGIPVRMPDGTDVQGMIGSLDPGPAAKPDILVRKRLSDDGSHLIFGSTAKFEPDANPSGPSIYDRDLGAATTHVVSKLPDGQNIPCISSCGSKGVAELDVSADGSRILIGQLVSTDAEGNDYWHLYMNVGDSPQGIDLMPGSTSGGLYDGMSGDGTRVYFTSRDQLSGDSDTSADIFLAQVGPSSSTLSRVSAGSGGAGDTDACNPGLNSERAHWNTVGPAANCDAVAIGGGGGVASGSGDIYFLSPELLAPGGTQNGANVFISRSGSAPRYVTTLESSYAVPQPPPKLHPFVRSFGELTNATGIAHDPVRDAVYVLELANGGRILKFDSKAHPVNFTAGSEQGGNILTGKDTPEERFRPFAPLGFPNQIAVDNSSGDLFVPSVVGEGGIERFASSGKFLQHIPVTFPIAVAIDQGNGDIYVTTFLNTLQVFDSSGAPKFEFPVIPGPIGVGVDSGGQIYVANGAEAVIYNAAGVLLKKLGVEVAKGLAVDPAGDHVYIAEGTQITELDQAGNPASIPSGVGRLSNSTALSVNAGNIFASDGEAGRVVVLGPAVIAPSPLYDNPAVLDAVSEAETRRTADFQVAATGDFAVFSSKLPLTGYDNDGHVEVFRYGTEGGAVECASCAATGARASGDASLARRGLSLSADGTVFFNSTEPLIPSDLNGSEDAFEWLDGEIGPISSGTSPIDSSLLSVTADGKDAYFFTRETLAPQDENGNSVKIYDARSLGGFPFQPALPPCKASDECHGPGTVAAPPPDIGTYVGSGGNEVAKQKQKKKKKRKHKQRRHRHGQRHQKGGDRNG